MNLIIDNFFNIICIISFVIGILSYIDGKNAKINAKSEKVVREYLYDLAEKNIDKEITESHINQLKQIEIELSSAIHKQIPILAKKVSLINSIEVIKNNLANDYNEYQYLKKELARFDIETSEIPEEISDIVVKNILPEYYLRKEKEKNFILLSVLFLIYIIISTVPALSFLQIVVVLFMYTPLASLLEQTFSKNLKLRLQLKCFYGIVIGVYGAMLSFSNFNIVNGVYNSQHEYVKIKLSPNNIIIIILIAISCFLVAFAMGVELKILVSKKFKTYINNSRKREIIFYSLYYLFWLVTIAVIIFMSLFISISLDRNKFCIIFEYRLLLICLTGGVICLIALVFPVLPPEIWNLREDKRK